MTCVICNLWHSMPYPNMWSTPVDVATVEQILCAGYLLKTQQPPEIAARLCERHVNILMLLDAPKVSISLAQQALAPILASPPEARPGQKVQFSCPGCGELISTGDVHGCPGEP